MLEILTYVLKIIGIPSICYIFYQGAKLIALHAICKHPELSNDKVKYITKMFTKDKYKSN
jgi:hypothetical protein